MRSIPKDHILASTKTAKAPHATGLSELGSLIRFHRKKSNLTQLELAKLAGVGKTAVFDVENEVKQPRLDTIARILSVLNIRVRFEGPMIAAYEEYRRAESESPV